MNVGVHLVTFTLPGGPPSIAPTLASAPDLEHVTGRYFANSRPKRSSARSYDEAVAARLWDVSCELTGVAPGATPRKDDA